MAETRFVSHLDLLFVVQGYFFKWTIVFRSSTHTYDLRVRDTHQFCTLRRFEFMHWHVPHTFVCQCPNVHSVGEDAGLRREVVERQ